MHPGYSMQPGGTVVAHHSVRLVDQMLLSDSTQIEDGRLLIHDIVRDLPQAWVDAMQGMVAGEKRRIWVPVSTQAAMGPRGHMWKGKREATVVDM